MHDSHQDNPHFADLHHCLSACWTAAFQCRRLIHTHGLTVLAVNRMFETLKSQPDSARDRNCIELISPHIYSNILHAEILFCLESLNVAKNSFSTVSNLSNVFAELHRELKSDENLKHVRLIRNVWIHVTDYLHGAGTQQDDYLQVSDHGEATADSISVSENSILVGARLNLLSACEWLIAKYPLIYRTVCSLIGWECDEYSPSRLDMISFDSNLLRL